MTPVLQFPPELLLLAQPIGALLLDVDGVLTDGGLYFSESGETLKRFNTLDGHGLKLLQQAGITPVVITGRDSAALRQRLAGLGIAHASFGTEDKWPAASRHLQALGLEPAQAAVIGDDWPDLPMMLRCGLPCAPANAHAEVLARARFVTPQAGGSGAVRAVCDLLLTAQGHYARMLQRLLP